MRTTTKMDDALARKVMNVGARAYMEALEGELQQLRAFFPDLTEPASSNGHRTLTPAASKSRRRRGMSAANRKAVSKRMKAYWKARREARAARR